MAEPLCCLPETVTTQLIVLNCHNKRRLAYINVNKQINDLELIKDVRHLTKKIANLKHFLKLQNIKNTIFQ